MTIEQKRRELFEAQVSTSAWCGLVDSPARDGEGYAECETHTAWLAFNDALDAVVIELPQAWNLSESEYRESCIDAIESTGLGLKVLP